MKRSVLEYRGFHFDEVFNLGDEIQSIAAARLLGDDVSYVSREHLNEVTEETLVSLNGYFMSSDNWPPSPAIRPILYSFHVSKNWEKVICSPAGVEYLKQHQPIGCRDPGTEKMLKKYGIDAYYSKCLTLTFDKRQVAPKDGKIFIVGLEKELESVIPRSIRDKAIRVEQSAIRLPYMDCDTKRRMAYRLLDVFRDKASLVITTKIHCAMPCLAMGIPVVFLYDKKKADDYRVHLIKDIVEIHYISTSWLARKLYNRNFLSKKINWNPAVPDIENEKKAIREGFYREMVRAQAAPR